MAGADLVNGTPIYDIKPYLPYADCKPDATGGFTDGTVKRTVEVRFSGETLKQLTEDERRELTAILKEDPRPAYQEDPEREYAFSFGGKNIRFKVAGGVLTVLEA